MQPEFSPQARGGEQQPSAYGQGYEVPPNFASQETAPGQNFEVLPQSPEQSPERSPIELAPPPPPMAPPVMQPQPVATSMPQQPQSEEVANPLAANDDDIIEKEWVNRAKQVIVQTKDDPRAREKAIGALQRDYLMKRYGKELGATND
ncbi:MAG: hypothetical protein ACTJG2_03445 [Candidatus Saccharimonadales bacterium]